MWTSRLLPHLFPAPALWGGVRRLGCARGVHTTCDWRRRNVPGGRISKTIPIRHGMSVSELASSLSLCPEDVKSKLNRMGINFTKYKGLSILDCERMVLDFGHRPQFTRVFSPPTRDPVSLEPRPPVVAVMGHVDHGKTTLLDSLRETAVAASEAGGITQHIGAFSVKLRSGPQLTFLDTPGHAAFSNMRARGANATDLVVLVVAADDGVMEQTRESIRMIKDANVPMVVAINKCDKHKKDIARTKRELLEAGVQLEEYGGDVQTVEISALNKVGLEALEEALLVQAEVCQVRGDPRGCVQGVVIETRVDKGLGPTATVVIQHGTLRPGQVLSAAGTWCKIRTMYNERGERIQSAPPSSPILTTGWRNLPPAGEICLQMKSEQEAKSSCEEWALINNTHRDHTPHTPHTDDDIVTMPLIVKGDVMGSVEALVNSLATQPQGVRLRVIHSGVGPVSDGDMDMAISTKATVLAFGVTCPKSLAGKAQSSNVTILSHNVIYKLLDMLRSILERLLPVMTEEEVLGTARVTNVYKLTGSKKATIAGSIVEDGTMVRSGIFRVIQRGKVVHEGKLSGFQTQKQDVQSAGKGVQVGIKFAQNFEDLQLDDEVVCFKTVRIPQTLKWDLGF